MSTTTIYPDPGEPGTTSMDGQCSHVSANDTWANIRGGVGTAYNQTQTSVGTVYLDSGTTTDRFDQINRNIYLFDTSSIPDSDTISATTFSLYGVSKVDNFNQAIGVVSSAPASNTQLAAGDFDSLGTTRYADTDIDITVASTTGYNDWAFNATGIAAISKTGVTKLGTRLSGDIDNSVPAWSSNLATFLEVYMADQTGTANDPKLVITHSTSFTPQIIII